MVCSKRIQEIEKRVYDTARSMVDFPIHTWSGSRASSSIHYQLFSQDVFYEPVEPQPWFHLLQNNEALEEMVTDWLHFLWCDAFRALGREDVVIELEAIRKEGL